MLALGLAIFYFGRSKAESDEAALPVIDRTVTVNPSRGISNGTEDSRVRKVINRISAKPEELVLDVVDSNLDEDDGEEQIMIVRNKNEPGTGIGIVVADYLPARKTWVRAFEGATPITKPTTFTLSVVDLAGDHSPMIVCIGLDQNNRQNLVAFRKAANASPLGYSLACSVGGDSVEIHEQNRPEAYELEKADASPWSILSYTRDSASTNFLDRMKTTWIWSRSKQRYEEGSREKVPGAATEHEALKRILSGPAGTFEAYIQGLWYREEGGIARESGNLIYFNMKGSAITFKSQSSQEVYSWTDSNPTNSGVYAVLENESVRELRRFAGIDLIGSDRLRIRVDDERSMRILPDNGYSGTYRRLVRRSSNDAYSGTDFSSPAGLPYDIAGEYRSLSGKKMRFTTEDFSVDDISGKTMEKGKFRMYRFRERLVLDLSTVGTDGLPAGRRLYEAAFSVSVADEMSRKTLRLIPAMMTMDGLVVLGEKMEIYSTGYDS